MSTVYTIDSHLWWQDEQCLHPVIMNTVWQVYDLYRKGNDDDQSTWNSSKQKWNKVRANMMAGWNVDIDVDKALKSLSVRLTHIQILV